MTTEGKKPTCESSSGVNIEDDKYESVGMLAIRDFLQERFENPKVREIFLLIYPTMKRLMEFSAVELLNQLPSDVKQLFNSLPALRYYLNKLEKLEILEKINGGKSGYKLKREEIEKIRPITQVLDNSEVKSQLELYYPQIYTICCIVARSFKKMYAGDTDEHIFSLTRVLLETGARLATNDLMKEQILQNQCPGCFYPLDVGFIEDELPPEPVEMLPDISAKTPTSPTPEIISSTPAPRPPPIEFTSPEPRQYPPEPRPPAQIPPVKTSKELLPSRILSLAGVQSEGLPEKRIAALLAPSGYECEEVISAIADLIYEGKLYQPAKGKYKAL